MVKETYKGDRTGLQYGLVEGATAKELAEKMDIALNTGWQPLGGVCMVPTEKGYGLMQSVAKAVLIEAPK